jgi:hypothetical protein
MLKIVSGPDYQLISKKSFLDTVENTCRLKRNPYPADQTWYCRMFTVFALGELYTLRPRPRDEKGVPGCAYFEYAMELFEDLYEEPTIEYIETILLIVGNLFSLIFVPLPGSLHLSFPKFQTAAFVPSLEYHRRNMQIITNIE